MPLQPKKQQQQLHKRIDVFKGDLAEFKTFYNAYPHKIFANQTFPETASNGTTTGQFYCIIFYEVWE